MIFGTIPAVLTLLRGSLSIQQLVTFRAFVAAILFLALAEVVARMSGHGSRDRSARLGRPWSWRAHWRRYAGVALGACLVAPDSLIFYSSFAYIDTSIAIALGFVYPVLVIVIVARLARRWPARRDITLGGAAIFGVVLVVNPSGTAQVRPLGVLLVFICAVLYATYAVVASGLTESVSPLRLGAQVMTGVCLTGAAVTLALGGSFLPADVQAWLFVSANGTLLVVAFAAYYAGLGRLGVTRASLLDTAQPVAATIAGVALLDERLSPGQYVGVLVIIGSVAVSSALSGRAETVTVEPR